MLKECIRLINDEAFCVLATSSSDRPHTSLMSYAADSEGREIFLVMHRNTKKYKKMEVNPHVSLLVDSRTSDRTEGTEKIKALTISGTFREFMEEARREYARKLLLERHPSLSSFINDQESEIVSIRIDSFQLVSGFRDIYYCKIEQP
ncbi:MAG TPA: pyridoxamine 5'-phosphate oxidase family protein [Syntrophales bacterium]|nr:pyridoxamine 5'-phosphate oxidase family protein [Syntrophales bacterium]